jgi:hypothetical protein
LKKFHIKISNLGSRIAAGLFVQVIGIFALGNNAVACSPGADAFYPKSAKEAVAVFYGEAIRAEIVGNSVLSSDDVKFVQVDFVVRESFKGKLAKKVSVLTHNAYMGGCGAAFIVGVSYFVVAMPFSGELTREPATKNALGYVMVFNVEDLPAYPPALNERLKALRDMR